MMYEILGTILTFILAVATLVIALLQRREIKRIYGKKDD